MHPKYKTIIFDFDGTLADTFPLIIKLLNKHAAEFGIDGIDPEEIPHLRDMSVPYLLKEFKINVLKWPIYYRRIVKLLQENLHNIKPFEGIPELLRDLKKEGYTLGILTRNSKGNVMRFLEVNDCNFFDFIFSEKRFFSSKSDLLKQILSQYKLDNTEVLYVGDELRDIEGAHEAQIDIAAVTWGFNSEKVLKKEVPEYLVDSIEELRELLLPFQS